MSFIKLNFAAIRFLICINIDEGCKESTKIYFISTSKQIKVSY